MLSKSHRHLGKIYADHYLSKHSKHHTLAFLWGCIEPDKNPVTFLKGSMRARFLRGHNYENALPFTNRLFSRLAEKRVWNMWDYYSLGKLVHYLTDSYTYPHNETFSGGLQAHRAYEKILWNRLEESVSLFLSNPLRVSFTADSLHALHWEYVHTSAGPDTDIRFALKACCSVLQTLCAGRRI